MTETTAFYSKDYWDFVFDELGRRPLVRVATVLLALVYGVAIYAPFLANDRPWLVEGVDGGAYAKAHRTIYPITLNLRRIVREGGGAHRRGDASLSYAQTLAEERGAIALRVETMGEQLAEEDREPLERLFARVDAALALALEADAFARRAEAIEVLRDRVAARLEAQGRGGALEALGAAAARRLDAAASGRDRLAAEAAEAAGDVVTLARAVRTEMAPAVAEPPEEGRSVALVPRTTYPVLEAVTRAEVYLMALWALVLTWPLWNGLLVNRLLLRGDRERIRNARRRKALAVLVLPVLPVLAWDDREATFDVSPYKAGLTSGEIRAERVVFPPVAFGYGETHIQEAFRPPTWSDEAEMTEEGYYARGARAPEPDPVTGFVRPATPVEVRAGEPALNAPRRHPLGTDSLGRDVLSRIVWGARISLSVGLVSTIILMAIGVVLGALAGYFGGGVDTAISRVIEVFQCFPVFFLILVIVAFVGPSILNIMVVIGLIRWTGVARLVRGEFMRLRSADFVVASEALGVSSVRTIFRHVLPNAMGPALVAGTFAIAAGILTESALSFLGFGIKAPIPSWGSLLTESRSSVDWWIQVFPGLCIFGTVVLYNVVGEGLRDAVDPRMKG